MRLARACSTSADSRMVRMTASRLSSAILRPSRMWARSRAFWRSNSVRRRMTSRRQSMWCWRIELERQRLWLAVDERDDVGVEGQLERRVLEQVVEHLARVRVALALDDHAHAVAVGLVPQVGDAVELAALDQLRDLLHQRRLVDLVGQLRGHDRGPALAGLLERALGLHHDPARGRGRTCRGWRPPAPTAR